jgi:O-succinylbenzoate synthase
VINIKPGRVGGLFEAKKIHDLCQARGVPVWCGGMHEYGIGRAHNIAISALPNFSIPGDISASDKYYAEDLIDPPVTVEHGKIQVPQTVGLGYTPNEERIARFTVNKLTFT